MINLEYLRSFRIGSYAIFDLGSAFLGVWLLSPWLTKILQKVKVTVSTKSWLLLTLPLSIVIHLLVGTRTIMVQNFLDLQTHWLLKLVVLMLLVLGIKDIKKTK